MKFAQYVSCWESQIARFLLLCRYLQDTQVRNNSTISSHLPSILRRLLNGKRPTCTPCFNIQSMMLILFNKYSDYRGLKKAINAIRRADEAAAPHKSSPLTGNATKDACRHSVTFTEADHVRKSPRSDNSATDATQRTKQKSSHSNSQGYGNSPPRRTYSIYAMGGQRIASRPFSTRC